MPKRQVELTVEQARFVSKEIDAGHFQSDSDVVGAGLRLLKKQRQRGQQAKQENKLRDMILEAVKQIDRGESVSLKNETEVKAHFSKLFARAAAKAQMKK